jgi:hypothetical protein
VKVVFKDDSSKTGGATKGTFNKVNIEYIYLHSDHVEVVAGNASRWIVTDDTNSLGALIIDTVNAVAPTSISDLYDKLVALIA